MLSTPLVTIVIRSMGRECLANAVASVALQRHRRLELVVVDATGGSHPPLPPAPGLDGVRLVSVGRRLNRPAAANVGLEAARGDWIGFLDDDDFLEPTHVDRLLARATSDDRPTLVYAQHWKLDRFHRVVHQRYHGFNPLILYYFCLIPGMACLLHRSLCDAGHRLDETLETSEDWDFWVRLIPHARFATIREPTHFYFAEAGTSGTGVGVNSRNRARHLRFHAIVRDRYAADRDRAWRAHFARLAEGIRMHEAGRIDAARALYADVLREHHDEPNALYLLGRTYQATGQLRTARALFRQAIWMNGDAGEFHFALGEVCAALDMPDEARDAFASAVRHAPALREASAEHLVRLADRGSAPGFVAVGVAPVARNALCPCGSGLRYKSCHGRVDIDGASGDTTAPPGVAALLDEGLAAMRSGDPARAKACYADAASLSPGCAEALHARALIDWDAGDLAAAQAGLTRAAALAPDDAQIAENAQSIARARYERVLAGRATAELATLPFLLREAAPWPRLAGGTLVHIVAPFENPFGGSEAHALELARILSVEVQVSLWATQGPVPQELATRGVRPVDAEHGSHPQGGVLVLVGSWQAPPSWARAAAPERVIVVHNVDEPAALLDLVLALHDQTERPIRLCMPSESFRVRSGLPGTVYRTPIDLLRFRPAEARFPAPGPFTVGRHSRNDHRKFHPRDPALFRRLGREGTRVRILGGTVLLRHFSPSRPEAGVELLPTGTEEASAFLRTLDAFVYRTSPMLVETSGRVVAEAMATGIPVICSRETGFSELVTDGIDGFLFDPDDDASLHARLEVLRADRGLRASIGGAARCKVEACFGPALAMEIRAAFLGG